MKSFLLVPILDEHTKLPAIFSNHILRTNSDALLRCFQTQAADMKDKNENNMVVFGRHEIVQAYKAACGCLSKGQQNGDMSNPRKSTNMGLFCNNCKLFEKMAMKLLSKKMIQLKKIPKSHQNLQLKHTEQEQNVAELKTEFCSNEKVLLSIMGKMTKQILIVDGEPFLEPKKKKRFLQQHTDKWEPEAIVPFHITMAFDFSKIIQTSTTEIFPKMNLLPDARITKEVINPFLKVRLVAVYNDVCQKEICTNTELNTYLEDETKPFQSPSKTKQIDFFSPDFVHQRNDFTIFLLEMGKSMPKFRVQIFLKALHKNKSVEIASSIFVEPKPTHVVIDENLSIYQISEELGFGSVEEMVVYFFEVCVIC